MSNDGDQSHSLEYVRSVLATLAEIPRGPADLAGIKKPDQILQAVVANRLGVGGKDKDQRAGHSKYRASYRFGDGYIHVKARADKRPHTKISLDQARKAASQKPVDLFLLLAWHPANERVDNSNAVDCWALPGTLVYQAIQDAPRSQGDYCQFGVTDNDRFDLSHMGHLRSATHLTTMELRNYRGSIILHPDEADALQRSVQLPH